VQATVIVKAQSSASEGSNAITNHIVNRSRHYVHVLPILAELHWLPIKHQIQYKVAVTVFKVLTTQQPSYLATIIRFRAASANFSPAEGI